jgi:hypothetical protein
LGEFSDRVGSVMRMVERRLWKKGIMLIGENRDEI